MVTLTPADLHTLTGADLLQQVQQQGTRQRGDVLLEGHTWRVYRSTLRRKGTFVNLWREAKTKTARAPRLSGCGVVQSSASQRCAQ